MRILAPTDFSDCSLNAINYAVQFLKQIPGKHELEILHCIDYVSRFSTKSKFDGIFVKKSKEGLDKITTRLTSNSNNVKFSTSLFKEKSKNFIPKRAKEINADLIVMGTTGLTDLKDILVGSVTEHVSRKAESPVLSIPATYKFKSIRNIVLGIDQHGLKNPNRIERFFKLFTSFKPKIHLVQVFVDGQKSLELSNFIEVSLNGMEFELHAVDFDSNISYSLNKFAKEVDGDMLTVIHHQRNWLNCLFHHSIMKEKLFNMKIPFLILPD